MSKLQPVLKRSFFRTWYIITLAVVGALDLNLHFLGPSGGKFSNSQTSNSRDKFWGGTEKGGPRDDTQKCDLKMGRNFGSRNLPVAEGGVM